MYGSRNIRLACLGSLENATDWPLRSSPMSYVRKGTADSRGSATSTWHPFWTCLLCSLASLTSCSHLLSLGLICWGNILFLGTILLCKSLGLLHPKTQFFLYTFSRGTSPSRQALELLSLTYYHNCDPTGSEYAPLILNKPPDTPTYAS